MIRLSMFVFWLLLLAAVAGRYQAEVSVRDARAELKRLQQEKSEEIREIQILRAELAYLESPDRLAGLAERLTELEPLSGAQLLTADDFLLAFGDAGNARAARLDQRRDANSAAPSLAVADLGALR